MYYITLLAFEQVVLVTLLVEKRTLKGRGKKKKRFEERRKILPTTAANAETSRKRNGKGKRKGAEKRETPRRPT